MIQKAPSDALAGIVYEKLKDKYPEFKPLPITRIPTDLINAQPNLQFAPHHTFTNKDFIFQLGPKCFSILCSKEYKGWDNYLKEIQWVFKEINNLEIIEKPLSLGVRYINFFERQDTFLKR